jgi:hypothetical protein
MPVSDMDEDPPKSSDGETLDAANKAEAEGAPEKSSISNDVTDGEDTLGVVRDVVGQREETPEAASSAEGGEDGEDAGDASTKEPDNESFSDVPFHKHPRFQELLRQKKEFQQDAIRYRNVERFLADNGLASDEAHTALSIAALAKVDPAKAWVEIRPWLQNLLVAAGEVLPEDLRGKVQAGEMSQDAALEVSRARARSASDEARRGFDAQRADRDRAAEAGRAIVEEVGSWEADRRRRDPNFEAKLPDLEREIAWIKSKEGLPKSRAEVRAQLDKAYKAVNERVRAAAPNPAAPPAKRPALRPITGGQAQGQQLSEVKSTMDVVQRVLAKRKA